MMGKKIFCKNYLFYYIQLGLFLLFLSTHLPGSVCCHIVGHVTTEK